MPVVCFCQTRSSTTSDEGNVGIYAQNTTRWTDWFRTTAGWRGDYFCGVGEFDLAAGELRQCAGRDRQPEIHDDVRSLLQDRIVLAAGMGYHSNDARGVTATQVAGDPTTPQDTDAVSGALARRRDRRPHQGDARISDSSISLFYLHQDSELVFDGDTGTTVRVRQVSAPASRSPTTIGSLHG